MQQIKLFYLELHGLPCFLEYGEVCFQVLESSELCYAEVWHYLARTRPFHGVVALWKDFGDLSTSRNCDELKDQLMVVNVGFVLKSLV